ncbi:hypothetical protein ABG775_01780 [Peribacillus simplex]|uniref:hypothetical protein n=1 Tax=Peribacillus TaxID=2675229 RepID=UPI001782534B|nr:hypothetical protein [Brevibacillus sp. JNUCC-41]QOS92085.1 hypothetical protein JNUCC41_10800 [Brevibacillus sp. JNUCC-41]
MYLRLDLNLLRGEAHEDEYTTLLVQGVDEDGVSSESTSKVITDINEIQAFIEKVNKLEVLQLPNKELLEKSKELNKKGNYFFIG